MLFILILLWFAFGLFGTILHRTLTGPLEVEGYALGLICGPFTAAVALLGLWLSILIGLSDLWDKVKDKKF